MTTTPSQLRLAADIIEKSLPWEYMAGGEWRNPYDSIALMDALDVGYEIRIKPYEPWTLTRHIPGFRELREGEEWHRADWTADMLPDGWRPLLRGERLYSGMGNDEYTSVPSKQNKSSDFHWQSCSQRTVYDKESGYWRTRRPLPEPPDKWAAEKQAHAEGREIEWRNRFEGYRWNAWMTAKYPMWYDDDHNEYRIAPEPEWIELDAADVPPGSCVKGPSDGDAEWVAVLSARNRGIRIILLQERLVTFTEMKHLNWQILRPGGEWTHCRKLKGGAV